MLLKILPAFAVCISASYYDPHVPEGSPWFEGWYTRISSSSTGHSFGIIVGHYPDNSTLTDPSVYVALIVDKGHDEAKVYEVYPDYAQVLVNGGPVIKNPKAEGDPNFSFSDRNGDVVQMQQIGQNNFLKMSFNNAQVQFEANLTEPQFWGPSGEGPEGWAGRLPLLKLHWFVYSHSSKAAFKLTTPEGIVTGTGKAHQEKNWGTAFPKSWMWAEALNDRGAKFALAGGLAPFGPVTVPNTFLVGYRSAKLEWNFHPQDPAIFYPKMDACRGFFELTAANVNKLLKIQMQATPKQSDGLFTVGGPTMTGFRSDSVESYRTTIVVEAYSGVTHTHLEERMEFTGGAIEFGGDYRCGKQSKDEEKESDPAPIALNMPILNSSVRRVRRELRTLTPEQRERVFSAMDVLKSLTTAEGQEKYGQHFVSYDQLVAQHLEAAAVLGCDEAHLGPAFGTYHRAYTLRFEEALLAVDPEIEALPYWDYNIEAQTSDPRKSEIWQWFGSSEGDPANSHAVKDGRFAHWRVRSNAKDVSSLTNPFGMLRSPWNVNPSVHITRNRYSCGSQTSFQVGMWDFCLNAQSYWEWYACIDPTIHTWAHSFLGGVWDTERNVSRVECFLTNAIGIPSAWAHGCLKCHENCTDPSTSQLSCYCKRSEELRCFTDSLLAKKAPTFGDFADAWASPNDPIFFFHHANVDRHLMTWQQKHRSKAPYYGMFSASIPCKGHGLHDIVSPNFPFAGSLFGLPSVKSLTNADILGADGLAYGPYTYDTLVDVTFSDNIRLMTSSGTQMLFSMPHLTVSAVCLSILLFMLVLNLKPRASRAACASIFTDEKVSGVELVDVEGHVSPAVQHLP